MPTATGLDLKVERVRANLTVTAVAARMGLSRQSVHGIERAMNPGPERIAQHREAVAALCDATVTPAVGEPRTTVPDIAEQVRDSFR